MGDPPGEGPWTLDLDRFRSGEDAYFGLLMERFGGTVRRIVMSFSTDPMHAEDLFQEVWVRVWTKRALYKPKGSFRGWVITISRNVCIVESRRRSADLKRLERVTLEEKVEMDLRTEGTAAWADNAQAEAAAVQAHRRLASLSSREQEAVVFRVMEGLSGEETATAMGISPSTVRVLVHRGLNKLRKETKHDG